MKRTFIALPKKHAAPMVSRRMGIRRFTTVAYKTDGEKDEPETKTVLGELNTNVKAMVKKNEDLETELKATKTELGEIKAANVTRDEADKKTKEALDVIIAERKNASYQKKEESFGDKVIAKLSEKKSEIETLKDTKSAPGISFEVKDAGTMLLSTNYTGGTVGLTSFDSDLTKPPRREPFIRQIVTNRPVTGMYVAWGEMENRDGGAGMTSEGQKKTQADFDIVERSKKVEKVTAFMKTSKEMLADLAYLSSEINTELVELIQLKLDEQILSGDGNAPNLKGILEYAPTFSIAGSSLAEGVDDPNNFDVVRAAAWQILNSGKNRFIPGYIILNPVDAAVMDLSKATDGHYILPPFSTAGGQNIAGVRVIQNVGVDAGDFLMGDFRKSILGVREEININVGYENDDFTKNLITILAEMRAVHYIKSNNLAAFVQGSFATAKAALSAA